MKGSQKIRLENSIQRDSETKSRGEYSISKTTDEWLQRQFTFLGRKQWCTVDAAKRSSGLGPGIFAGFRDLEVTSGVKNVQKPTWCERY